MLDLEVFNFFHDLVGQSILLDWLIIFLGTYLGYLLIIGILVLLFYEKNWKIRFQNFALITLVAILSRGLLTEIIRFFYFRARPFVELNFAPLINHSAEASAFPSGHAAFYFALGLSLFLINRFWGSIYILAALLMGIARIAAGVHWPLDILFGFLVALVSLIVVKLLLVRQR
ncbi:MAG: phosphatase PAP2 family protein [Candidatus Harrisonbacteria bacterium]|nr:phosphatase PAP2 family protein [Candidatus Harrisonbacteria bacterium]